jgi:phage tail-like protein
MPPIVGTKKFVHQRSAFLVEVPGIGTAVFQKCSELKMEVEVSSIREGGTLTPHKQPALVSYPDITLERGMSSDGGLYDWSQLVADAAQQSGLVEPEYKKTIDIVQIDRARKPRLRFRLYGAFPVGYVAGEWDNESSEFVIEKMTIAYDYFKRITV